MNSYTKSTLQKSFTHSKYLSLVPVHHVDNIWMLGAAVKSAILCRRGGNIVTSATDNTDATPNLLEV